MIDGSMKELRINDLYPLARNCKTILLFSLSDWFRLEVPIGPLPSTLMKRLALRGN
jgi:hypothetical protein